MTTIINSPTPQNAPEQAQESSGSGFIFGLLGFLVFLAVVFYFGMPAINRMRSSEEMYIPTPQVNVESPKVVVPDTIKVVPADSEE